MLSSISFFGPASTSSAATTVTLPPAKLDPQMPMRSGSTPGSPCRLRDGVAIVFDLLQRNQPRAFEYHIHFSIRHPLVVRVTLATAPG
jgi:hypothetical protein